jgi:hypothetical protein
MVWRGTLCGTLAMVPVEVVFRAASKKNALSL